MKQYEILESTPMRFHKLVWWIWIPLKALYLLAGNLTVAAVYESETFALVDYVGRGALIVICIFAFVNCFKWNSNAWKGVVAVYSFEVVFDVLVIVIAVAVFSQGILTYVVSLMIHAIPYIPIMIYYWKRKSVFKEKE